MNDEDPGDQHGSYVRPRVATEVLHIKDVTLRKWADQGKVRFIRTPSGQRLYHLPSLQLLYSCPSASSPPKQKICYCRVSSKKQLDDLKRQQDFFKQQFPNHILVTDIGSGINWNRKGLKTLLEQSLSGNISEIVVAHRDRLCRFAFDLLSFIFQQGGTQLIVLDQENNQSSTQELTDDILSIIHVYSCKAMGKRRYKSNTDQKNKDLPQQETNPNIKTMDGDVSVCVQQDS